MVRDFAENSSAFQPLRTLLDHQLLNDVEGPPKPTSEVLAKWVFDPVEPALAGQPRNQ